LNPVPERFPALDFFKEKTNAIERNNRSGFHRFLSSKKSTILSSPSFSGGALHEQEP